MLRAIWVRFTEIRAWHIKKFSLVRFSKISHFSEQIIQCIWFRKLCLNPPNSTCVRTGSLWIHLPNLQFYLPWAIGQWDVSSPEDIYLSMDVIMSSISMICGFNSLAAELFWRNEYMYFVIMMLTYALWIPQQYSNLIIWNHDFLIFCIMICFEYDSITNLSV